MSPFIVSIFNSIAFAIYCYLSSYIILQKKQNSIKKNILAFIILLIMYYYILCLLDSIFAMFFSGICAFLFIKIVFKENIYMSLFVSLIINTIKILFKIFILTILNNDSILLFNTYKTLDLNDFYINVLSMFLALILILSLTKPLKKMIKRISRSKNREIILLIAIYINFILIILYQPPKELLSIRTITDLLMIFAVTSIVIFNISSEKKMESLTNHYQEIFEYSKANEELLTRYKMQVHENKNKLLMIKGMLDGPKKDTKKYIDSILKEINENKSNSNYWLTELIYIPFPGIRNFINYKLIKLKELGAQIEVFVSSELKDLDTSSLNNDEYNQLTTILGVILDNMIESITETEDKLVSLNLYIENNKIHGEFVNSFAGKIDLSRLNEVGYTTKGEQHGVGLPLVAKITKTNDRFECNPKILDNFFVQHLTMKINDKNNLQKISKN